MSLSTTNPPEEIIHNLDYWNSHMDAELERYKLRGGRHQLDDGKGFLSGFSSLNSAHKFLVISLFALSLFSIVYFLSDLFNGLISDKKVDQFWQKTVTQFDFNRLGVSVGFTTFHSVELGGGEKIITGYEYANPNSSVPISQYCFLANELRMIKTPENILSVVYRDGEPTWYPSEKSPMLALAQNYCRFKTVN